MAPSASNVSKTLRTVTLIKIQELSKQRAQYESRKDAVLAAAAAPSLTQQERIRILAKGVEELVYRDGDRKLRDAGRDKMEEIDKRLDRSVWDASVPAALLDSHEAFARSELDVKSRRLSAAELYSRLVMEWMDSDAAPPTEDLGLHDHAKAAAEAEERQKQHLENLCDRFEKVVFTPLETDENAITSYLAELFSDDAAKAALESARHELRYHLLSFNSSPVFTEEVVRRCVKGLSREDCISEEKLALLRDFAENDGLILREIADVLNTRFLDLDNWNWDADVDEGIPVFPRQQLNGKYRIWMDEDVLQAILIHYVGVRCCVALKDALEVIVKRDGDNMVWKWHTGPPMSKEAIARWEYYYTGEGGRCPERTERSTVDKTRRLNYIDHFFLAALPRKMAELGVGGFDYDDCDSCDDFDSYNDDDDDDDDEDEVRYQREEIADKKPVDTRQFLLRILATETMLQRAIHGGTAVVQSDLKWFGAGLSHTTIFAVMRFFGFPEKLVGFFKKVLEAPLNLETSSSGPRTRRRGIPMARSPGRMMGEIVLFVMDFAVNHETGLLLYRLHDDLWVTGSPEDTAKAWATMQRCAKVLGLEFNEHKTGSVYLVDDETGRDAAITAALPPGPVKVGHLVINPESGKWVIDQESVAEHVAQLRKQLAECHSVLDWIRTWNSCISRFFGNTFGEPAVCFGDEHVKSILETYQKMHRDIFAPWYGVQNATLTDTQHSAVYYIKKKIMERFGVDDPSDAFVAFPDELGGLGLVNPFFSFFVDREYDWPPEEKIKRFFEKEQAKYQSAKKVFDHKRPAYRAQKELPWFKASEVLKPEEMNVFFDFEEWSAHREMTSQDLAVLYGELCDKGASSKKRGQEPRLSRKLKASLDLDRLPHKAGVTKGEMLLLIQMYCDEAHEKFGSLHLVDTRSLPLGVLTMMAEKSVRWGMVL